MGYILFIVLMLIIVYAFYSLSKDTLELIKSLPFFNKDADIIEIEKPKTEIIAIIAHVDSIPGTGYDTTKKEVRESYRTLLPMVVGAGDNTVAISLVDDIKWQAKSEHRHHYFLEDLVEAIHENVSNHFIFRLDWKADVSDLTWHIENALENTEFSPTLPERDRYPSDASVQYGLKDFKPACRTSPVFEDFILALNEVGLSLCFMETLSDSFFLFLFEIEYREPLLHAVRNTGAGPGHGFIG